MEKRKTIAIEKGIRIDGDIHNIVAIMPDSTSEPVTINEIDEQHSSITLESPSVIPIAIGIEGFARMVLQDQPTLAELGTAIALGMQARQMSQQEDRLLDLCTEPVYFSQANIVCAIKHCRKTAPMAVLVEHQKPGLYLIKPLCNWHMQDHLSRAAMIRAREKGQNETVTYPVGDEG